ncbi:PREDICTED: protein TBRG4, partial [Chaetura pelagica]|uniref:protein TBRG4 n=1 Tax=Chaetura pelagica TaxID=8897 RepID=UPI0005234437
RLVRRCCCWDLGTFLPPPAATPASLLHPAGKVALARALPPTPLALIHISNLLGRADGFSVREEVEEGGNADKMIGELIETASSPQELFQLSELHALNSNQASLVITQLSRLAVEKKLDTENILRDERFQQLLGLTDSQISQVWNNTLQGKESKLLQEVLKKLELRWTELEGTRTVVMLMSKVGHVSPALMDRLEDKALELAEQFGPEDIRKITLALAYQRRRCIPLLRALSYHLLQKHSELSLNVLTDLIFAYGKLNFHQPQVLQKVASDLQPHLPTMTPLELTRCTRSFALLKWLSLPLFEAIAQYALDNAQQLPVTHLCGIIMSFARLNFQPSGNEDFFSMVHKVLQAQLDQLEPQLLTELVWSLCVLQQGRAPYLQRVLAPEFHAWIRDDQSLKAQNLRLKLVHINTTAKLEVPEYQGPFLPPEMLVSPERVGDKVTLLQSSLREALLGPGQRKEGRKDVGVVSGVPVSPPPPADAEVVVNSENKPVPLRDFAAPHLPRCEGTEPLPPGARRVAFLRWEFPNFSNRSKELLGRYAMARRHLQAAGFLLVDVPHYEVLELKQERQRWAYLRDKLNKAVARELAA